MFNVSPKNIPIGAQVLYLYRESKRFQTETELLYPHTVYDVEEKRVGVISNIADGGEDGYCGRFHYLIEGLWYAKHDVLGIIKAI